jgi:hypothetical protein
MGLKVYILCFVLENMRKGILEYVKNSVDFGLPKYAHRPTALPKQGV